jgi:beta-galactosidase
MDAVETTFGIRTFEFTADDGFHLNGAIAGVGNGDHHFLAEFDAKRVALFYGKAMLILRTEEGLPGALGVEARSDGLASAGVSLHSE